MRYKPADGLVVRDFRTMDLIPDDGAEIDETDPTWARIIHDGDLVPVADTPAAKNAKKGVNDAGTV